MQALCRQYGIAVLDAYRINQYVPYKRLVFWLFFQAMFCHQGNNIILKNLKNTKLCYGMYGMWRGM